MQMGLPACFNGPQVAAAADCPLKDLNSYENVKSINTL